MAPWEWCAARFAVLRNVALGTPSSKAFQSNMKELHA